MKLRRVYIASLTATLVIIFLMYNVQSPANHRRDMSLLASVSCQNASTTVSRVVVSEPINATKRYHASYSGVGRKVVQVRTARPFVLVFPATSKCSGCGTFSSMNVSSPSQSTLIEHFLSIREVENRTMVDVGAKVGYFSLLAAAWGSRVVAYEPDPNLSAYIEASARLMDADKRIQTLHSPDWLQSVHALAPISVLRLADLGAQEGSMDDHLPGGLYEILQKSDIVLVTFRNIHVMSRTLLQNIYSQGGFKHVSSFYEVGASYSKYPVQNVLLTDLTIVISTAQQNVEITDVSFIFARAAMLSPVNLHVPQK